jgi:hypothetical protein
MSYNEFYQSQIDESVVENGLKVNGDLIVSGNIIGEIIGAAGDLQTTGADVNVSASAPPSTGQVLIANTATDATWQTIPPLGGQTQLVDTFSLIRTDQGLPVGDPRGTNSTDLQRVRVDATRVAAGTVSVVCGGQSNQTTSESSFVGGGSNNRDTAIGVSNTIVAGANNAITGGFYSFIGAGNSNTISRTRGVIAGGESNDIAGTADYASILGGQNNNINAANSTICGGKNHDITSGSGHFVGGGEDNNITGGAFSNILGGKTNTISQSYSCIAGGRTSTITNEGCFMFSPSAIAYASTTDNTAYFNVGKVKIDGANVGSGSLELSGNINMNYTYPDNRAIVLSDSSGTHKNRLETIGDNGGAFSFSTNGVYSGAGSAFDHDDATLAYWDFVLDPRTGVDNFKVRRAPIGASTDVVNLLEIDNAGDVSVPTGDLNVTTGKITIGVATGLEKGPTTSWNVAGGDGDLTTASYSTYVGNLAGSGNPNSFNTFIGRNSGGSGGFQNTFVGSSSGDNITGGNNVCIGYSAGGALAGSANCLMLGVDADGLPNVNNQIAIGSNVICDAVGQTMVGSTSCNQLVNQGDNTCDLGTATHRFKDFYMGGDANIGGAINGILRLSGTVTPRAAGNYAITDDVTGITMKVPDGYIVAKSLVWGIGLDVNSTFTFGGAGVDGGPIVSIDEQLGGVSTRAEILAGKNENSLFNNAIAGLVIKYPFISLVLGTTQTAGSIRYIIECIPPP